MRLQGSDAANTVHETLKGPRLARRASGELVIAGKFSGSVDLDPDPAVDDVRTAEGLSDIFILESKLFVA